MLTLNFTRIFQLKGINRPFTHLITKGYSSSVATKITNNRIREINLDRLEKFCIDFNCTPNDILDFRPNPNLPLAPDHALHSLTKKELSDEINAVINSLSVEKIQQIHDIIQNME